MISRFKTPRIRDEKHRRFVASLPCCVSGVHGRTQAAHIRIGGLGGMGLKPSDAFVVPLSIEEHTRQHAQGEKTYWGDKLEAAKNLANALYVKTGDRDCALKLLAKFRR